MPYSQIIPEPTQAQPAINVSDYLALETKAELIELATASNVLYADDARGDNNDNFDCFSLLEIASKEGKQRHVSTYLNDCNPSEEDVLKSFYRALEAGQVEIALLLLSHKQTLNRVSQLMLVRSSPFNKEFHFNYLEKIKKSNHYNFRFNKDAVKGNIALIIAAGLPEPTLFNELLKYPEIGRKFIKSGLAAFLSATLSESGRIKNDINLDIAFNLLESSAIYNYAQGRSHDYNELLKKFDEQTQESMDEAITTMASESSFTSLFAFSSRADKSSFASLSSASGSSGRTTPAAESPAIGFLRKSGSSPFFSSAGSVRPASVMETLIEADPNTTSVMDTPRAFDSKIDSALVNQEGGMSDSESVDDEGLERHSPTYF